MSNQIVISSGAKVRELEGVLTGTAGIVNALGINVPSGIPQLDGSGKILVSQLPNSVMEYKGSWNAATNTPTLVNGTGNAGDVYLCEVAGTVNFGAGPITFAVGDQVIYSGTIWQRASGATGTVTSVAVTESGDALTITGSPITTSGTINIGFAGTSGQYVNGAGGLTTFPSLTGFVPYTGATGDVNLGLFSIISNRVSAIGDNSTYGGTLSIKQNNVRSLLGTGYTELFGKTNLLGISFGVGSIANLSNSVLTAERTFTLPDLSGTLALLEGTQTFTGTKTFGSSVSINTGGQADLSIVSSAGNSSNINSFVGGVLKSTISTSATEFKLISAIDNILKFQSSTNFRASLIFSNSADYNYTFPAASGTIALTSNLSSYVPYTGATNNVDLGSNYITSATIVFWKGTGSGLGNIGIGRIVPLGQNTTGQGNIGIGENSLFSNTTGSNNIAIGVSSTQANTTGINNIGIGLGSNSNNVTGSANVAVGVGALNFNTNNYNTAVGHLALYFNTTGTNNVAIGYSSLYTNTTGSQNTALGSGTLYSNTTASNNTAIGNQALQQNTTGVNNTAIGSFSSYVNTTGQNNTSVGASTLIANTTGSQNTALGTASLQSNTTGESNVAVGVSSLGVNTIGQYNVAVGRSASNANTTGNYNTALGSQALANITTGSQNIAIGYNSGAGITTGSQNTIIGIVTGLSSTLSNNIILADGAGNIRYQWDGTNNVFGNPISGTTGAFSSSGGSGTFTIDHSSGSGVALTITKGGNGEGLVINKTSGSGNALSVTGSTSLGALSGTTGIFSSSVSINSSAVANYDLNIYNTIPRIQLQNPTSGTTTGDGFHIYQSGSDSYLLNKEAANLYLGSNNGINLTIASTGAATFSSSVAATTGLFAINNSDVGNATGIRLQQSGSGDAAISYLLTGVREWLVGVDNSDSDSYKINNITGGADFNNIGVTITNSGNIGINTNSPNSLASTTNLVVRGITGSATALVQSLSADAGCSVSLYSGASSSDDPAIIFQKNLRFGSVTDVGLGSFTERMRITSGGIINTTSRLNVNGAGDNSLFSLINNGTTYTLGFSPNASASISTTLTITTATTTWIYNGTGTATWTLPNPSGTNQMFWIKNAGTGVLTLNAFSGTNIINNSATAVSSITIAVGATALIQQDGNVKSYQLQ
jgi:hypothetical protein